jgi:hypothetical protein
VFLFQCTQQWSYSVNPHSITMLMATFALADPHSLPRCCVRGIGGVDFLPHTFRSGLWPRREYVWKILAMLDRTHTLRRALSPPHTHTARRALRCHHHIEIPYGVSRIFLLSPPVALRGQQMAKSACCGKVAEKIKVRGERARVYLIRRLRCGGEKCEKKFHKGALTNCSARGEISSAQ